MRKILLLLSFIATTTLFGQTTWYNPQTEGASLWGQGLREQKRSNYYQRIPDEYQKKLRTPLWGLSKNSSGESLRFYSNTNNITVRYKLADKNFSMPHMQSTGKSGVDLYSIDNHGIERWYGGQYNFSDTTTYRYHGLIYHNPYHDRGYEYQLWLPPYSTVEWLEIGVDEGSHFSFIEPTKEKPIVVYGTSISQGACASRPGMIWSTLVARELDVNLINYGFSGNGMLESAMTDIISNIDSKLIIIDCMPNMIRDQELIKPRLKEMIKSLRKVRPSTPILIAEHAGYGHSATISEWHTKDTNSNKLQREAYDELLAEGITSIHYLNSSEIGIPSDGLVDGIHPTDLGMVAYSNAYVKKLRQILKMEEGESSAEKAVVQRRQPQAYEWRERHESFLETIKTNPPKVVILGNSIMHQWDSKDPDSWKKWFKPIGALNMGCGWDKIENILWRIYHGELDGYEAKRVIVTIGVNNREDNTNEEMAAGIRLIIKAIKARQPKAEIKINGIFPCRSYEERFEELNSLIEEVAKEENVKYGDPGALLLMSTGKIDPTLFVNDGLHLNKNGYTCIVKEFLK